MVGEWQHSIPVDTSTDMEGREGRIERIVLATNYRLENCVPRRAP